MLLMFLRGLLQYVQLSGVLPEQLFLTRPVLVFIYVVITPPLTIFTLKSCFNFVMPINCAGGERSIVQKNCNCVLRAFLKIIVNDSLRYTGKGVSVFQKDLQIEYIRRFHFLSDFKQGGGYQLRALILICVRTRHMVAYIQA